MHQRSSVARHWESYLGLLSHVFPKSTQSSDDEVLGDVNVTVGEEKSERDSGVRQTGSWPYFYLYKSVLQGKLCLWVPLS